MIEARRAVTLIIGGMPVLVVSGLIEGTISQLHEPVVAYWAKLTFAALVGCGLDYYLVFSGRDEQPVPAQQRSAAASSSVGP